MKIGKCQKSVPLPRKLVVKHETAHHWQTLNPFLNCQVKQTFLSLFLFASNRNISFVWNHCRIRNSKNYHFIWSKVTRIHVPRPCEHLENMWPLVIDYSAWFPTPGSQQHWVWVRRQEWEEICRRFVGIFFLLLMEIVHVAQKCIKC